MNTKLEVIKLTNEDVIATSCSGDLFECIEGTIINHSKNDQEVGNVDLDGQFFHYENGKYILCPTYKKVFDETSDSDEAEIAAYRAHGIERKN